MGTDPAAIAAQVNYLRQILNHVNPYTGVALKDEPAILFIELVNEPWHHPEDLDGSIRYLNALTDAVRSTGCTKLVFHNVSQDFRIAEAIRRSRVQGVTFGWYPTGLELRPRAAGQLPPRASTPTPTCCGPSWPACRASSTSSTAPTCAPARCTRRWRGPSARVGTQFAAMFAYDMLATASRNLGWQTHYLNLVYTPRKAMSAVIAAEAMHRLPRMRSYGAVSAEHAVRRLPRLRRRATWASWSRATRSSTPARRAPRRPIRRRCAASRATAPRPSVTYEGEGIYFLDKVRAGRLAPRGLSRRGAGPRPVRAAQPRQDRDARDQPRLADDGRAAGPRRGVHGAARRRAGRSRRPARPLAPTPAGRRSPSRPACTS